MKNKVYSVSVNFSGTSWAEACQKTSNLDADIQRLAKAGGDDVHMHQYREPMLGAPVVLIECPEAFLEKVKKLPLFDAVRPVDATTPTIRRTDAPQIEPPEAMMPKRKGPKL